MMGGRGGGAVTQTLPQIYQHVLAQFVGLAYSNHLSCVYAGIQYTSAGKMEDELQMQDKQLLK